MARYRVTVQEQGEADHSGKDIGRADTYADAQGIAQKHATEHGQALGAWKAQGAADEPKRAWCLTLGEEFTYVIRQR